MNKLILMVGNIGTGKTTTAKLLMKDNLNILTLDNDTIATMLNGGHYGHDIWTDKHWPLYSAIKITCTRLILEAGFDVILDGTHMSKSSRKRFIDIGKELASPVIVYVHRNAEEGLIRRLKEPRGSSLDVWKEVHRKFAVKYEEPTIEEGIQTIFDGEFMEEIASAN